MSDNDDLRERLAQAIRKCSYNTQYYCIGLHVSRKFADAVIAEMQAQKPPYCLRCGIPHSDVCRRDVSERDDA